MENDTIRRMIMDSILDSVKKKLGIDAKYTIFDDGDLIDHINTVFADLNQLGVGPPEGFSIEDSDVIWEDYLTDDALKLQQVKTYMHLRIKLIFDPPQQTSVLTSYQEQIEKLEWRLNIAAESIQSE